MSALRLPGPDGRIRLVPIDDGAVGRVFGQSRGGMASVIGQMTPIVKTADPIPEWRREQVAAAQKRYRQRQAAK
jgi:hypothetical protein